MTKIIEQLNDRWEARCNNCDEQPEAEETFIAIVGDAIFEDAGEDLDQLPDLTLGLCRPCFEKLQPLIARHEKPVIERDDEGEGDED